MFQDLTVELDAGFQQFTRRICTEFDNADQDRTLCRADFTDYRYI